jgi:hypothetical protein
MRFPSVTHKEMKMMMKKTFTMLTAAAAIGIGMLAVPSSASARVLYNAYGRAHISRGYAPPAGQINERAFRGARTPDQEGRQDFQTDGSFQ